MSIHVLPDTIRIVDSHTGGEPTRLIVEGGPALQGTLLNQLQQLERDHDRYRLVALGEPRGASHMVGALLTHSPDPRCAFGVIFFNNVGYLGMCGHAMIGLLVSLHYLGKITTGTHSIDTPVGIVEATLKDRNTVSIRNVPSYRFAEHVRVEVPGLGIVSGDIAWGGNWFFLVHDHNQRVESDNIPKLTDVAIRIRTALQTNGITGADNAYIDHIELMVQQPRPEINARSFILCPGSEYDRSPCGTGTSAVMACEFAAGRLQLGQAWHQESIIGSVFCGYLEQQDNQLISCLTGSAFVNGDTRIIIDPQDPFAWGIA